MNKQKKTLRISIGKLGLDGHDRGSKIIAKALRDAGMEVIYTGLRKTSQDITNIAIEEDVDVIGISLLSGAHETLLPELCKLLVDNNAGDIHVIAGGIIPKADIPFLKRAGVREVFGPGTPTGDVIKYVHNITRET